jgi:ketosteroid isomerase-like protein
VSSSARDVALRYVELVNEGRLGELVDLYADDGEVLPPNPAYAPVVKGREALTAHYQRSVGKRVPQLELTHLYADGDTCVVELVSQTNDEDHPWGIVDIFTTGPDGLITRMAAYRRPLPAADKESGE